MAPEPFVPADWVVPAPLATATFRLAPLGPEHNESDHAAWGGSIDHIRATPGFAREEGGSDAWPVPMSSEANLRDLEMHAREFRDREAFAYTVLAPETDVDRVIGCIYIDPDETGEASATMRCWVTASAASLDVPLADAVRAWLATDWPFESVRFPGR
jgi:hypothetical protein